MFPSFSHNPVIPFTPTLVGSTTPGVGTYSIREGYYQLNGKQLTVTTKVYFSAHTGTGIIQIKGDPFTAYAPIVNTPATTIFENLTFSSGNIPFWLVVADACYLMRFSSAASAAFISFSDDSAFGFTMSATYFIK